MSGGSPSKPKPVQASEGEKAQAQLAKDQIAYYRSTYAPLESQFRDEMGQDFSDRFSGRNATASSREATQTLRDAGMMGATMDVGGIAEATTAGRVAGWAQGRRERDDGRLDSLKVGLGVTADASKSLSESGRIQTNAAIDRSREEIAKAQAKMDMQGAVLGAAATLGGAYGTNKYMGKKAAMQDQKDIDAFRSTPGFNSAEARMGTGNALTLARAGMLDQAPVLTGRRNMNRGSQR